MKSMIDDFRFVGEILFKRNHPHRKANRSIASFTVATLVFYSFVSISQAQLDKSSEPLTGSALYRDVERYVAAYVCLERCRELSQLHKRTKRQAPIGATLVFCL